jgi:ribosomal protein S18 acetylase RimI-like enzyme
LDAPTPVTIRLARPEDALGMASVYLAAFPESVQHFFGRRPPNPQAVADLLTIPLLAEPGCGCVAVAGEAVVGYCLAPAHISRLPRALWRGRLARMLWRWLMGRYDLGLDAALRLARNHAIGSRRDPHHVEAHILSLAVHPARQGEGLGRALLQRGLDYLQEQGAGRVRLEVRPDNTGALRLYESAGFATVGRTRDAQGDWLIMTREAQP